MKDVSSLRICEEDGWIAEIVFSSLKRILGEDLLSRKFKAQKIEAGLKGMLYNKFMSF